MEAKIKCVHCEKSNFIKKGFRRTENRGRIQTYRCLDCGKKFTQDDGFYRMRNSPEKITSAIDLYFSNLSSRKVRNYFKRHLDHNASHITILDWCRKYVLKVSKYIEQQKPQLSGLMYADETEINRRKNNDVFWCSVDWDTRYINATLYSHKDQNMKDAINFMNKIKQSGNTKYIQTDALRMYPKAFKKAFKIDKRRKSYIEHRVNNVSKTKKHNVRIETVFSKIKDRVYDFRSLKALWSAPILLLGLVIQHNFIEQHSTIKTYPCELAGLNLDLGVNRWLGLIKLATT